MDGDFKMGWYFNHGDFKKMDVVECRGMEFLVPMKWKLLCVQGRKGEGERGGGTLKAQIVKDGIILYELVLG